MTNGEILKSLGEVWAAIEGVQRAFGAPGDHGYNTREGQALYGLAKASIGLAATMRLLQQGHADEERRDRLIADNRRLISALQLARSIVIEERDGILESHCNLDPQTLEPIPETLLDIARAPLEEVERILAEVDGAIAQALAPEPEAAQ